MNRSYKPHLVLALLAFLASSLAGVAAQPPNIIFFLVDDMGWQETSVPFHTQATELNRRYRTPNMERLAADGMKFTQAYVSAVCSPTRVSALTGMNAARHRVTNWTLRENVSPDQPHKLVEPPAWNLSGICTNAGVERTMQVTPLPALLRDGGYRTIHVGKAHFGAQDTPGANPLNLGFDVNIAGHCAGGPGSYWGERNFSAAWRSKNPGDRIWDVPGLEAYHGTNIFLTEALTLEAIKAVEKSVADREPFYLYMAHYAVHAPWEKDDRFYQKYVDAGLKPFEATLASMIEGMDKSLGDVMAALDRLGVAENTIILFMSDNGAPSQCPPNLPLRGHKLTPYEGGTRVPMLAKWPGVVKPGTTCRSPVIIEDVFPTILELAGAERHGNTIQKVDGVSFVPLLKAEVGAALDRSFIWHFPHNYSGQGPFSAIRVGTWKLIYHHADRRLELFDLDTDISETNNLAAKEIDRGRQLAAKLSAILKARGAQMPLAKPSSQPVPWPDESETSSPPGAQGSAQVAPPSSDETLPATAEPVSARSATARFTVLSFNILEVGADATYVGFPNSRFGGSRHDDIAKVIRECGADIVGVQEGGDIAPLLKELGPDWHGLATGKSKYTSAVVSRHPLEALTVSDFLIAARVKVRGGPQLVLVNTHWSPSGGKGGYGPELVQKRLKAAQVPTDLDVFEREIIRDARMPDGPRGYTRTIEALRPHLAAGENVILTGDFNEPSFLDWTAAAAERGLDRWPANSTGRPLRFKIAWEGSRRLADLGLRDAYRTVFPDEIAKPGITWTPRYADGVSGRRPYGGQVLDRIDFIYFGGSGLRLMSAGVVGEGKETCEFVHAGPWVSDHRAVKATFELSPPD